MAGVRRSRGGAAPPPPPPSFADTVDGLQALAARARALRESLGAQPLPGVARAGAATTAAPAAQAPPYPFAFDRLLAQIARSTRATEHLTAQVVALLETLQVTGAPQPAPAGALETAPQPVRIPVVPLVALAAGQQLLVHPFAVPADGRLRIAVRVNASAGGTILQMSRDAGSTWGNFNANAGGGLSPGGEYRFRDDVAEGESLQLSVSAATTLDVLDAFYIPGMED